MNIFCQYELVVVPEWPCGQGEMSEASEVKLQRTSFNNIKYGPLLISTFCKNTSFDTLDTCPLGLFEKWPRHFPSFPAEKKKRVSIKRNLNCLNLGGGCIWQKIHIPSDPQPSLRLSHTAFAAQQPPLFHSHHHFFLIKKNRILVLHGDLKEMIFGSLSVHWNMFKMKRLGWSTLKIKIGNKNL